MNLAATRAPARSPTSPNGALRRQRDHPAQAEPASLLDHEDPDRCLSAQAGRDDRKAGVPASHKRRPIAGLGRGADGNKFFTLDLSPPGAHSLRRGHPRHALVCRPRLPPCSYGYSDQIGRAAAGAAGAAGAQFCGRSGQRVPSDRRQRGRRLQAGLILPASMLLDEPRIPPFGDQQPEFCTMTQRKCKQPKCGKPHAALGNCSCGSVQLLAADPS